MKPSPEKPSTPMAIGAFALMVAIILIVAGKHWHALNGWPS